MDAQERIQTLVNDNAVLLFMKGNPEFPQCGFSMTATRILQALNVPFLTVDVLEDPEIRQGIKQFSNWPTIPQLYIDQQFVGGSDICMEMWQNGELQQLVSEHPKNSAPTAD